LAVTTETLFGVAIPAIVAGAEDPPLPTPAVEAPPAATLDAPHPARKLTMAATQAKPKVLNSNLLNVISESSI
jgi:hypothetical protein